MSTKQWDNRVSTSGQYWTIATGVTKVASTRHGEYGVVVDVDPGFNQDNFFELQKFETAVPSLSGTEFSSSGNATKVFVDYPVGYRPQPPSVSAFGGLPSWAELQAKCVKVAALTNPSRAMVSLPVTLGEMRDIPSALQRFGRNALSAVAKGYITWRFAYAPMFSDLRTISKFTKSIQSRFDYLRKLSERKWVGKRVKLSNTKVWLPHEPVTVHSEGAHIGGFRHILHTRNEWASLRWKLLVSLPPDVLGRFELSERLVKGITCYEALQMAWELTPWSWLTDWFVNLSDWLAANNNTIPAIASGFCWMCTDSAKTQYDIQAKPAWVNLHGPHFEQTTRKIRLVPGVSPLIPPVPALPAITGGQASILGALICTKTDIKALRLRDLGRKRK